jgi:hypothetical protein
MQIVFNFFGVIHCNADQKGIDRRRDKTRCLSMKVSFVASFSLKTDLTRHTWFTTHWNTASLRMFIFSRVETEFLRSYSRSLIAHTLSMPIFILDHFYLRPDTSTIRWIANVIQYKVYWYVTGNKHTCIRNIIHVLLIQFAMKHCWHRHKNEGNNYLLFFVFTRIDKTPEVNDTELTSSSHSLHLICS